MVGCLFKGYGSGKPARLVGPANLESCSIPPFSTSSPHTITKQLLPLLTMYAVRYNLAMRSLLPLEKGTATEARLAQRAPLLQYVATTTEDSLAKEALLPLDISLVVSESFLSRATLSSLCLVLKGLNRIFTPILYHTVTLLSGYSRWERKLKEMSKLDSETHLQLTRHLEIGYSRLAPIVDPAVLGLCLRR
jgi:hypothetical protein